MTSDRQLLTKIKRERAELQLRPWELAPSEVDDGASPYPASSAGTAAWHQAQAWRAEIREREPGYFEG